MPGWIKTIGFQLCVCIHQHVCQLNTMDEDRSLSCASVCLHQHVGQLNTMDEDRSHASVCIHQHVEAS